MKIWKYALWLEVINWHLKSTHWEKKSENLFAGSRTQSMHSPPETWGLYKPIVYLFWAGSGELKIVCYLIFVTIICRIHFNVQYTSSVCVHKLRWFLPSWQIYPLTLPVTQHARQSAVCGNEHVILGTVLGKHENFFTSLYPLDLRPYCMNSIWVFLTNNWYKGKFGVHHIFVKPDLRQNHVLWSSYFYESRFKTKTMSGCHYLRSPDFCVPQIFL